MPRRLLPLWAVGGCLVFALGGCNRPKVAAAPAPLPAAPPNVAGLVAEYAAPLTRGDVAVQGYGVVIGLGTNGSTTVPPHLEEYLKQYLLKLGLGSWRSGTHIVDPGAFLRDPDTAVVLLGGSFPIGARQGSSFDVYVRSLPNTQTRSLAGGVLIPAELHLAVQSAAMPGGPTSLWAKASGPVFINPFADPTKPSESVKFLEGRILGGGVVLQSRAPRLVLRQPDRARSVLIQRKINERFSSGAEAVAKATDPSVIELSIPRTYRDHPERFLELVLHLSLQSEASSVEAMAREIAEAINRPAAQHEDLALVWEGMGRQVVPVVQRLYGSEIAPTAYYAARTGLRMGDPTAVEPLLRFAAGIEPSLQVPAIEELGRYPDLARAVPVLRKLLDDPGELVRVAACDALVKHGDQQSVTRVNVPGQFQMDLVDSSGGYVIYATQAREGRIILFGRDMKVCGSIFYKGPDDLVTVNARLGDKQLALFRKIPRGGQVSDVVRCDFHVRSLAEAMGGRPQMDEDNNFKGLGMTYGQVVSVLYHLCKRGDIPAKFVLQPLPDEQRIYQQLDSSGRPDMPGQ